VTTFIESCSRSDPGHLMLQLAFSRISTFDVIVWTNGSVPFLWIPGVKDCRCPSGLQRIFPTLRCPTQLVQFPPASQLSRLH